MTSTARLADFRCPEKSAGLPRSKIRAALDLACVRPAGIDTLWVGACWRSCHTPRFSLPDKSTDWYPTGLGQIDSSCLYDSGTILKSSPFVIAVGV
jgi:hypothetical protein